MKVLQIRFIASTILFSSLIGSSILSSTISNSWAQETPQIPDWIQNNAGWWANDQITENEFLRAIEYLIKNNIIVIPDSPTHEKPKVSIDFSYTKLVPNWIKNNAGWWAGGQIDDNTFVSGLQWLISNGIIQVEVKTPNQASNDVVFASGVNVNVSDLVFLYSGFFSLYSFPGDFVVEVQEGELDCIAESIDQGSILCPVKKLWVSSVVTLNPDMMDLYKEVALWNESKKVAVVYPIFTATAYQNKNIDAPFEQYSGFYDYFQGFCDDCTTVKMISEDNYHKLTHNASGMGIQVLSLLGYTTLTDIDIDQNPDILKEFDGVVMLHNEYVTTNIFDAVTSHPNVLYLYPNALYAEIEVDYVDNTITLIRGHGYPEPQIDNGFDWEFDNTRPYEFDTDCFDMEFYQVDNGWMTTCYPDLLMKESAVLLSAIKNIMINSGE